MVLLVESVQKLLTGTHLLTFRFWKKYLLSEMERETETENSYKD